MFRIRNIIGYGENNEKVYVRYPDDERFSCVEYIDAYQTELTLVLSKRCNQKVNVYISHIEIPKDKNIRAICEATAETLKLNLDAVFGKSRHPDLVLCRMFSVQIMLDIYIKPSQIEEQTPWKNRLYDYYRKKLADLRETEPAIDVKYKDVFDKVMNKLKS